VKNQENKDSLYKNQAVHIDEKTNFT